MFVKFESSAIFAGRGFMAFIHRKGIKSYCEKFWKNCKSSEKFKILFQSFITDDNCQYWKNLDEMTLSSPNYPDFPNYADSIGCEWLISAPERFIIALEFNNFTVSDIPYFQD